MPRRRGSNAPETRESLHTALKKWYARPGDEIEAQLGRYRVDVLREDLAIEIQTRHLGSIREKLRRLAQRHSVLLVHPVAKEKWLVYLDPDTGEPVRRRKSPKRGRVTDIFAELVYLGELINHPNLTLEVIMIRENELRSDDGQGSWRRRGGSIVGHELIEVVEQARFGSGLDLAALIPGELAQPFTNRELAGSLALRRRTAQKMSYSLCRMGAVERVGKRGREVLYARVPTHA